MARCFALQLLCVAVLVLSSPQGAEAAAKKKKKEKTVVSGATAAGGTIWSQDGKGTIHTDVDAGFDTKHYFLTSVTTGSGRSSLDGTWALDNLTGTALPRARDKAFRVRLKYSDNRNVTTWAAKSWRVRWVAVSEKDSIVAGVTSDTEAYVKLLGELIAENKEVVRGLLDRDYQLPVSKLPKEKPPKAEKPADASSEETASADEDADEDAGDGEAAAEGAATEKGEDADAEETETADAADAADAEEDAEDETTV